MTTLHTAIMPDSHLQLGTATAIASLSATALWQGGIPHMQQITGGKRRHPTLTLRRGMDSRVRLRSRVSRVQGVSSTLGSQ